MNEALDADTMAFWNGLVFRVRVAQSASSGADDGAEVAFGFLRQKVLQGEVSDATQIQMQDPDTQEWGEWQPLAEAKQVREPWACYRAAVVAGIYGGGRR
jgi:hypothetical protein